MVALSPVAHVGRIEDGAPVQQFDIQALFADAGRIDALDPFGCRDGDGAQGARRDLFGKLAPARDARRLCDQAGQHVIAATRAAARPGHRAGIGLQLCHKIVKRGDVRRGGHDDGQVFAGQARDERDHVQTDGRVVGEDRADHHHAAGHQGVSFAAVRVDELRQADGAAGAPSMFMGTGRDVVARRWASTARAMAAKRP